MRAYRLSIRDVLVLTVGALTFMITLLIAQQGYRDWRQLALLRDLKDALSLSDLLFDATDKLAVERDTALSLLASSDANQDEVLRARLTDARRAADDARRQTVDALNKYAFPELIGLRAKSA